jgi:hypothetical protein
MAFDTLKKMEISLFTYISYCTYIFMDIVDETLATISEVGHRSADQM